MPSSKDAIYTLDPDIYLLVQKIANNNLFTAKMFFAFAQVYKNRQIAWFDSDPKKAEFNINVKEALYDALVFLQEIIDDETS